PSPQERRGPSCPAADGRGAPATAPSSWAAASLRLRDANLLHQRFQNVLKQVWYSGPLRGGQAGSADGVGPHSQAADPLGRSGGRARSIASAGRLLGSSGGRRPPPRLRGGGGPRGRFA